MTLKITSDNIASATLSTLGGGVKITTVAYPESATAANPAGGETITVTGSGFNSGIIVYINNTIPCATTYINNTSLTFVAPATGVGTYNIVLYNTDGSSGVKPIGIIFSSLPSWVTASGALLGVSINTAYSQSVSATGDGTITYSLTSGSLPTGLSLNSSTGAITGTPTVEATSNFTITATDSQNQTTSRSFSIAVVTTVSAVEYLVVAGGGGGGMTPPQGYGSGGGAGGYLTASGIGVSPGITYTITIGAGGTRASAGVTNPTIGGNSSISGSGFTTVTSVGGGRGTLTGSDAGGNGGSGGGGGGRFNDVSRPGGKGIYPGSTYIDAPRQGYDGGAGDPGPGWGGGGGGAGAVGSSGSTTSNGGVGLQSSISGTATYYAGGGGGGDSGVGGLGGGGSLTSDAVKNGVTNTGGGGAASPGASATAGTGGSGIVIIRYDSAFPAAASTTGSPTITTAGGYRVYKFTASGSITF